MRITPMPWHQSQGNAVMTDLSRRTFVMMSAGGVLIPSTAGADQTDYSDEQRTLRAMLKSAPHPDDARCVYLVEYKNEGGAWSPSARMLRGSSIMPASLTAIPDRWRLSNGQRITTLDQDFTVSIKRTRSRHGA